ncbi:MAG: phage major capsid protein [Mesorhizobium sp.]|uniref:phage major capsid protein n=1 Tax=Mesorhizobium sp. M7A.F.Ca.ET.027.02.1.1 TaxID=2496655 RepID=UPI000FD3EF2F|nr:phage major capsid protein [Mesorhizobium sp. M7A.F.Ca.ET.027.02.1.1]RVD15375.1 phage major capsid protein [Mesorhizobium sp. M7A.F.Ca.ET.027.02.1.1]RWD08230.1 MAG: phage major capsid protein [Mesorhizobium sp.]
MAEIGLTALRAKRVDVVGKMKTIIEKAETEDRDLSAEEIAEYDQLKLDKASLDARIERATDLETATDALGAAVPARARQAGLPRPGGDPAARDFENMGEFMHSVRFRPSDQRLNFVEGAGSEGSDELNAEFRMDNGPSGGFMIPPQLRSVIMSVPPQDALVRPRANVIEAGDPPDAGITMPALDQTGANPANMFGGMSFSWIGEGDEKPETDAKLREFTLTPYEIAGIVTVTDKLLRNWRASASFIENLMRGGVSAAEDYAFLRGDGNKKPLGVINAGATKWINRANANQVGYVDLVNIVARLLMRGATQPVWSIPQAVLPQIALLTDPEGHYIWQANAKDGFAGTLLGYPVRWNNRAPGLGSKGDVLLADWSYYVIKDGSGPFVATSEHVKFTQNKTVIKIFWNVDGAPWLTAPIKEENGYDVSPFVGLDVPA